jgi:hypothetical protein
MADDKDTNGEGVTAGGAPTAGAATNDTGPDPIFESYIYEFTNSGLGGDPGGRPGTIGGPVSGQDPKYRVLTYPFIPRQAPNIEGT